MWIILEGCDGSGKSTLANEITRQLQENGQDVAQTHLGPPARTRLGAIEEATSAEYNDYDPRGTNLVSDRWGWGCPVYGPLYRPELDFDGYGEVTEAGWRYLELFAAARGAYCVLVDVDPELARQRIGPRGDDYVNVADLESICEKYRALYDHSVIGSAIVNSTEPGDVPELATWIISQAALEKPSPNLELWPSYVGPVYPDRLIFTASDREDQIDTLGRFQPDEWKTVGLIPGGNIEF